MGKRFDGEEMGYAGLLAELRQIRREIAGLREEIRAAAREGTAAPTEPTEPPVPARRWLIPDEFAFRGLPDRGRSRATEVHARVVGWRAGPEWTPPRALLWDIAALLVVGLVAWLLRYVDVSGIPQGFHGDEAATGLEAHRILDHGWIGVYTGIAGGNPTGAYYLAAVLISLVDDPVVAVRLLSVIGGSLAVVALYVLVRRNLGFGSAVAGATILAFSEWHIQFSRIGFVTGLWPTCVLVGAIALMEAIRTSSWRWWAAAGALLSTGIYVYNGHAPFMLVLALFAGWELFGWPAVAAAGCLVAATAAAWPLALGLVVAAIVLLALTRRLRERPRLINAGVFVGTSFLVMRAMVQFARHHRQDYFGRSEQLSVFRTDEWKATGGVVDQARFLIDRYHLFWDRLTFQPVPNGADLSGITPLVPELTLWLCLAGLVIALIRRPHPLVVLAALSVAATPLAAVLTDMTMRRSLVMIPFLALLAGVGAVEVLRVGLRRGRLAGTVTGLALAGLIAFSCYRNYVDFFDETAGSGPVQQIFATEMREATEFMNSLPDDAYVYLFSDRWGSRYDTVLLLAPNLRAEDPLPRWGGSGSYAVDRSKGAPVFMLMGVHIAELPQIQALYPGGEVVVGKTLPLPLDGPSFVAYILPPESAEK